VALAVSFLLHGALVFMPPLGTSTAVAPPRARGAESLGRARSFDVTLEQAAEPAGTTGSPAREARKEDAQPAPPPSRGIDLLPVPAPAYYTVDQLTTLPRAASRPVLDVPKAVARRVSGRVVLRLMIDELGNVESVEVESTNLPKAVYELATKAFANLRFAPGEIDGRRVRTLLKVEIDYKDGLRPVTQ
jgi:TonB family protein